jgi:hypothetical protein
MVNDDPDEAIAWAPSLGATGVSKTRRARQGRQAGVEG